MRIMGQRSAELYKRCLAAKQLEAYANLCEVMEIFNDLGFKEAINNDRAYNFASFSDAEDGKKTPTPRTPNAVTEVLRKYLPLAAKGNTEFLEDKRFHEAVSKIGKDADINALVSGLENYSYYASVHRCFRAADEAFNKCVTVHKDGSISISGRNLREYQEAVKNGKFSSSVKKFDSNFAKHSRTYLGHEHYMLATESLARIGAIQPEMVAAKGFSRITPETYDANIRGFYREHLKTESKEALSEYKDKIPGNISEKIYTHTLGKRFTGNDVKKTITALLLVASLATITLPAYSYVQEHNSSTIYTVQEEGRQLQISKETYDSIKQNRELLDAMKNSTNWPTREQLTTVRNALDENMDLIFTDLVTKAVNEAKPDWKVNSVETEYNEHKAKNGEAENSVIVEYVDEEGHTQTTVITNLSDGNLMRSIMHGFSNDFTTIDGTFALEKSLDQKFSALLKDAFDESKTWKERDAAFSALYDYLEYFQKAEEIVGAKELSYKDGLFSDRLSMELPDKTKEATIDDDDLTH